MLEKSKRARLYHLHHPKQITLTLNTKKNIQSLSEEDREKDIECINVAKLLKKTGFSGMNVATGPRKIVFI